VVPQYYKEALALILDKEQDHNQDEQRTQEIENAAEIVYGLIHQRYILTNRGLQKMMIKYHEGHFGCCPRVLCANQHVLPVGLHDMLGESTLNVYCPRCNEIYAAKMPRNKQVDGAYFGTTFPHLLFTVYPDQRPQSPFAPFVPRCFGFKIHPSAYDDAKRAKDEHAAESK
jgi:casein kinase II subunit beta